MDCAIDIPMGTGAGVIVATVTKGGGGTSELVSEWAGKGWIMQLTYPWPPGIR